MRVYEGTVILVGEDKREAERLAMLLKRNVQLVKLPAANAPWEIPNEQKVGTAEYEPARARFGCY